MATIIKAAEQSWSKPSLAFNFDDLAGNASKYLDDVRSQAAEIIAHAEREAELIYHRAEHDGLAAAAEKMSRAVDEQVLVKLQTLLPALQDVIAQIEHSRHECLAHWQAAGLRVATAVAQRFVRRQLSATPEVTLDLIREALELAAGGTQLRVFIHPADQQLLAGPFQEMTLEFSHLGGIEWIADHAIQRGGCRVETRHGVIDQQFTAQLRRIEEELR